MDEDLKRRIELEALISEREGMVAENLARSMLGERMAYFNDDFFRNAQEIRELIK